MKESIRADSKIVIWRPHMESSTDVSEVVVTASGMLRTDDRKLKTALQTDATVWFA